MATNQSSGASTERVELELSSDSAARVDRSCDIAAGLTPAMYSLKGSLKELQNATENATEATEKATANATTETWGAPWWKKQEEGSLVGPQGHFLDFYRLGYEEPDGLSV
ncbi:hypothetical protein EDC01DRAFT_635332 [Geopyxis carbonaria]|nr:hypothetical protein EDC01DRAFT_635332 [Geopyxis carbonaria]